MNFNWLLGLAVLGCKLAKGGFLESLQNFNIELLQSERALELALEGVNNIQTLSSQIHSMRKVIEEMIKKLKEKLGESQTLDAETCNALTSDLKRLKFKCTFVSTLMENLERVLDGIQSLKSRMTQEALGILQENMAQHTYIQKEELGQTKIALEEEINELEKKIKTAE
ncbi:hypothetical protein BdWA1_000633 [Babesia duncani]|uniref:Uncharacterized protein n=1 Tax=Babesia duncani TaxID=323732 RepID=A0AAD9PHK3_9APIC|nr:hypothetical protein BdWA1_003959 [Babesia duncani]KAK2197630.1 hypothetical protein BdWA1_000633 [Babesia duncani]